ncbi:hypothetical protein ABQE93_10595 [Mycolicibacterium sp. XJ662]
MRFNPPPGWPVPQTNWDPPAGWSPDPSWPPAPAGWQFWIEDATPIAEQRQPPLSSGSPVRASSRRRRPGVAAAVAILVIGGAGGLFGWLRYQNEQALVASLTTVDVEGAGTDIDGVTTAPDGTLYVLTGAGDHLSPDDTAVLKVDPATGASQALPIPPEAFSIFRNRFPVAVGPDGSVFTGSHLWDPHTGTIQQITSERAQHAAIDARGRLVYSVSVEDKNDNYRATTTVYRVSARGEPYVLATVPGYVQGLAVDSRSQVLLHIEAGQLGEKTAKLLRISDDGDLETVAIDDIDSSSEIAVNDAGRLVYVCADEHAMCSRELGAPSSTRLEFTTVRPMWTVDEAVRVSGLDPITWLPEGKALVSTTVRGKWVVVVAQP